MESSDNGNQIMVSNPEMNEVVVGSAALDVDAAAINSAARDLGLKSVRAWVSDPSAGKRRSSGAERAQRHRERKEREGMKQISGTLPTDLHHAVQELAKRTRAGESAVSVLHDVFHATATATNAVPMALSPATKPTELIIPTPYPAPVEPDSQATQTAQPPFDVSSVETRLESLLGNLPAWRRWLLRRLLPPLTV